jgi:hypothetical protein
MFLACITTEADAAAIRAVFDQEGELSAAIASARPRAATVLLLIRF